MFQRAKYIEPSEKLDWKHLKDPAATEKFDGGSFFLVFDKDGKPSYISRRPSVKGGHPNRTSALPHLSDFVLPEFAGHVYNGELIHSGLNKNSPESHSTLSGILNSLPPKAIATQSKLGPVRYAIHDVINPNPSTYKAKLELMKRLETTVGKPDLIFTPEVHTTIPAIEALIDRTKRQGREGVIITSLSTPEEVNPRFKIKHKLTYNLLVTDIVQEVDKDGKPKQSMGALIVSDATGRPVGKVGTGFSRDQRIDAWNNPHNWLGKLIQVSSMGFAVNALRMPVYNGDADGDIDRVT